MYLITSADYIVSELQTEFGKIPPSFLPLQNKRLYEHQISLFEKNESIILSLPESFELSESDKLKLNEKNIKIIYVPDGFSLGLSIIYVLKTLADFNEPIKILFGDTLFDRLPSGKDIYYVSEYVDNYNWAIANDSNEKYIYSGFFSFSNQRMLIKSITESKFNFIVGANHYKNRIVINEIEAKHWLDFGHSNTYFRSKMNFTTERFFNNLKIDGNSVVKYSTDKNKISGEASWFLGLPNSLKKFTPSFFEYVENHDTCYYEIEYLYLNSLSELFVFGLNEIFVWKNIISSCDNFLINLRMHKAPNPVSYKEQCMKMYFEKTKLRLIEFSKINNIDLDVNWIINGNKTPSLNFILHHISDLIDLPSEEFITVSHGDFCFSNILYNFRSNNVKVIDPRGVDSDGNHSCYGDIRYDIAKLAHSVIGLYDFIISGFYEYKSHEKYNINFKVHTNDNIVKVQKHFLTQTFAGLSIDKACTYPIMIYLFMSMLPLHKDNEKRQMALLANSLKLYLEFINR